MMKAISSNSFDNKSLFRFIFRSRRMWNFYYYMWYIKGAYCFGKSGILENWTTNVAVHIKLIACLQAKERNACMATIQIPPHLIKINLSTLCHRDLITILFSNNQDVSFLRSYRKSPTVLLTAKHSTSGGNAAAECNGIVSWIEVLTNVWSHWASNLSAVTIYCLT